MAEKTPNYDLVKPLESDFYDVGVQNGNMDRIDAALAAVERAASTHAIQHSAGGSDPVTPAAIGAATIAELAGKALGDGYVNAVDLNTVIDSGMYRVQDNCTNVPPGIYGYGQLLVIHGSGDTISQIYFDHNQSRAYLRSGNPPDVGGSGAWSEWVLIATADDLAGKLDKYTKVIQAPQSWAELWALGPGVYTWVQASPFSWEPTETPSGSIRAELTVHSTPDMFSTLTATLRYVDGAGSLQSFIGEAVTDATDGRWVSLAAADDLAGKAGSLGNISQEIFNDATYPHPYFGTTIDLAGQPSTGQYRIIYIPYFSNKEGYSVQIAVGAVANDGLHWRKAFGPNWQKWNYAATADELAGKADIGFYQGDMNSLTTDGHYRFDTNPNTPPGVQYSQAIVSHGLNSDTAAQIVVGYSSSKMYFRGASVVNGVWNWYNWTRVATADDIAAITPRRIGAATDSHGHDLNTLSGTLPVSKGGTGETSLAGLVSALVGKGAVRIQTGTYVGTNAYEVENPNSLTFSFQPKLVFIFGRDELAVYRWGFGLMRECAQNNNAYYGLDGTSVSGNTMSWFYKGSGLNARYQYNSGGVTYSYLAIG